MDIKSVTEHAFFFILLAFVGYVAWSMLQPFFIALVLAAIIVILSYPLFDKVLKYTPRQNRTLASLVFSLLILILFVAPIFFLSNLLITESVDFYTSLDKQELEIDKLLGKVEGFVGGYIPGVELSLTEQVKSSGGWVTKNIGNIFTGTVSAIFILFIAMFGAFYMYRDGLRFVDWLIKISPLVDTDDRLIVKRIARAIRSVATGTLLLSIVQGVVAGAGFAIFGISNPVLWGMVAALGALLPGIGTTFIMVPAVAYLFFFGSIPMAIGLAVWAIASIVLIDNILGSILMSRGNNLHPFIMLLSVLGGISYFGPIGFMVGPVVVTLFIVLLEIYMHNVSLDEPVTVKVKKTRTKSK